MDEVSRPAGPAGARPEDDSPAEPTSSSSGTPAAEESSYGQIVKSSALIGGSQVVTIAVGIVRTKAMAVLLGPAGFGLMGLYGSIIELVLSIVSLGIGSSGVRQIAEAAASDDTKRIGRTAVVLRRTAVVLGVLGMMVTVVFAKPLSMLTFGNADHASAVALLSAAVFFRAVAAGQGALIQGLRRVADLAKLGIMGAVLGAPVAIGVVWLFGEAGIAPALIAVAAVGLAVSWWYSRKISISPPAMSFPEMRREAASLLKLGFAFMASGVLMMAAAYAVRTIVLRMEGLEAAGFYSAAWTLGGLYVGIILQAMGADFYPRLVGSATDHPRCNRLVNEQTRISLLLAGPGVIATLTFAPLVIAIFYSTEFGGAVEVLRWFCLGIALRVITWPIGFIIVAKNQRTIFIATEVAWTLVNVGLTWVCVRTFGLNGAGIAFFASYVFHGLMIYPIVHKLTGFRWSPENIELELIFLTSTLLAFLGFYALPPLWATAGGAIIMIASGVYSLRVLVTLVSLDGIPWPVRNVLKFGRVIR